MRLLALITCLAALTACTTFPDLDERVSEPARNAAFPTLGPLDQVLAQAAPTQTAPDFSADLDTRVAALRARAARLSGQVIDGQTRDRLDEAVR